MSWRDVLKVHPACELFPPLPPDELRELGNDIKKNRLQERAKVMRQGDDFVLVDGRSRLDAIEAVGLPIKVFEGDTPNSKFFQILEVDNPVAFVISANVRRRHLTSEDRHRIIGELLKLDPSKSDRQIAKQVGASPTTVGTARKEAEAKGEVSNLDTRIDARGREQPAHRPRPSVPPSGAPAPAPPAIRKFTPGETLADIIWTIEALVRSIADVDPAEVVAELGPTALIELARNAELGSAWLGALQVLAACAAKGAPNRPAGNGGAPHPQLDLFLRGSGTPVIHVDVADDRHGG